jgi:superfamily II RNA helicase
VTFDGVFERGLMLSDAEKDQTIEELERELEYEMLAEEAPDHFSNLQNLYWDGQLNNYEKNELIEALVQNDISSSYDVDILKCEAQDEICDYFPSNFKRVESSKSDAKVPNFRENEIVYNPIKIMQDYFRPSLIETGQQYLDIFSQKLSKDTRICDLIKKNIASESYNEIDNANILPTSKKETKYLLGISDKNLITAKNKAEDLIQRVCATPVKAEEKENFMNKRNLHVLPDMPALGSEKFEGSFEDLVKMYENDTNRKVIKVQGKKDMSKLNKNDGRNKEFAVEDETQRSLIDKYFEENKPALTYPFPLDDFQARALYRLEKKDSVFVAAHTSAGKTVVAEYAIALSRLHKCKTIYTSPIKALSNQKYRDFQKKFGDVGIITGDVNLKPDASCLIMTTEILRNMLYRGADTIKNIEWVIFDEIHYINNAERGVVWEESIIMLPDHIGIVMLSATVQNVYQFAEWVGRITKKRIFVQKTDHRPVPLEHYLYFKEMILLKPKDGVFTTRNYDNYMKGLKDQKRAKTNLRHDKKEEMYQKKAALSQMNNQSERVKKMSSVGKSKISMDYLMKKQIERATNEGGQKRALPEVDDILKLVNKLKKENLLPAIFFVFSKKRLTQIVEDLQRHVSLITPEERNEIEAFYYTAIKRLKKKDQSIYQLTWLKEIMCRGIGIHHGDLLPLGKEIVEILLQRNLIKLLFATDSFAMGLNMPTKTVIFNGLRKHDGTEFRNLLGSEYTQMSGRAGRRGLDEKGMVLSFFHRRFDLL